MSEWAPKRFWKAAAVTEVDEGFGVALDDRTVMTPGKATLIVPTRAMAEAIAREWDAQVEKINPLSMPVTRSANTAIDKVRVQRGDVADLLAAYGDSDLLCYRAQSPDALIEREVQHWDPYLDWAASALGARLHPRSGIMHAAQDAEVLENLRARVHAQTAFELTAFHDLVSLTGSLILGFAAIAEYRTAAAIWDTSRVDEQWQEEQWGADEEAQEAANRKKNAFLHAHRFFFLASAGLDRSAIA